VPPIIEQNSALVLDRVQFHALFAPDVDPQSAAFMAASQPGNFRLHFWSGAT
jgi:hypothetical protein